MRKYLSAQIQEQGKKQQNVKLTLEEPSRIDRYSLKQVSVASASGVLTLDLARGNAFNCTLTENITSVVIVGYPPSGEYAHLSLKLTQHASSAKTVTWAAKYKFPGGADHVMTATLSGHDRLMIEGDDADTSWDVTFAQAFS